MPLLNYTTKIDVEKTIAEIQKMLAVRGAQKIMVDYEDTYVKALTFSMVIGERNIGFRLPTDWKPVYSVLEKDPNARRRGCVTQEQAVRVAWRIVKDWIEAQMAIVDTKMVKIQDVFLPYVVVKGGLTLSEKFNQDNNFLLGDGK